MINSYLLFIYMNAFLLYLLCSEMSKPFIHMNVNQQNV